MKIYSDIWGVKATGFTNMYCPSCKKETNFAVFPLGRSQCTVCAKSPYTLTGFDNLLR